MKIRPIHTLEEEPGQGSVLLTDGPEGTAWQRFVSDGHWHSVTGKVEDWETLRLTSQTRASKGMSPAFLVYELEPIDPGPTT